MNFLILDTWKVVFDLNVSPELYLSSLVYGTVKDNVNGGFPCAVPISTIATFHKMKKLTRDLALIVSALKESSFLVSFFLVVTSSMNYNCWSNQIAREKDNEIPSDN